MKIEGDGVRERFDEANAGGDRNRAGEGEGDTERHRKMQGCEGCRFGDIPGGGSDGAASRVFDAFGHDDSPVELSIVNANYYHQ